MNIPLTVLDDTATMTTPQPTHDAAEAGRFSPLADPFGRTIGYLRLSLTGACAMKCLYCRPEKLENPRDEVRLTPDETHDLVAHLARRHGLRKVRLTGGDPTSRSDLTEIIRAAASVRGVDDLAMTTNGLTLERRAGEYADAGLRRINVSLDTLDRDRFAELTGVDGLDRVLAGIERARGAGLWPIKLNTVVLRNRNEGDLVDLLRFAAERGLILRYIELMPMGPLADRWAERYVPESEMRRRLEPHVLDWTPLEQGHDAARSYRVTLRGGGTAVVGFITPMSCNFCASCNRIRLAADGTLYPCLMDKPAHSMLPAIRPRFDAEMFDELLGTALAHKAREHPHDGPAVMTRIGG